MSHGYAPTFAQEVVSTVKIARPRRTWERGSKAAGGDECSRAGAEYAGGIDVLKGRHKVRHGGRVRCVKRRATARSARHSRDGADRRAR